MACSITWPQPYRGPMSNTDMEAQSLSNTSKGSSRLMGACVWEFPLYHFHRVMLYESRPQRMQAVIYVKCKSTDFWVSIVSQVQNWVNESLDFKIWVLPYIMCNLFLQFPCEQSIKLLPKIILCLFNYSPHVVGFAYLPKNIQTSTQSCDYCMWQFICYE